MIRFRRSPDFVIGNQDNPYMLRWYLIPRNRLFNIYLHKIVRDDDDRALHDHPWISVSILLNGAYTEVTEKGRRVFKVGSVIFRSHKYKHRLEVLDNKPCWTLFITGPKIRVWGFHCLKGFVPWYDFVAEDDHGNVGKGCGEMS